MELQLGASPGIWQFPTNLDFCCIYRVPNCLHRANPEAYTPQLVLIGPLHHLLKTQAFENHLLITKSTGYLNMEKHKRAYLEAFEERLEGQNTIQELRDVITAEEGRIRASYSESTTLIAQEAFVDIILYDSVFILEFLLRARSGNRQARIGDPLMDEACLENVIKKDLILLENQLPYFILERLFGTIVPILLPNVTLRSLIFTYFGFQGQIENNFAFCHFTDLLRCIRVRTLAPNHRQGEFNIIQHMYNADKLDSLGAKFQAVGESFSLVVNFVDGCLQIPCFVFDGNTEVILRNIMALEQCHYPFEAYVSNHIIFLNYLIYTKKDFGLLVEKGIIRNMVGHDGQVVEIVNKLCSGVNKFGSYYSGIATQVIGHYTNLELGTYPGMWLYPRDVEHCCIYRVPDTMRRANPEAYTPLLVIIGPLHHSLKSQARGDITNTNSIGYLNMEMHKKTYLAQFTERLGAQDGIAQFRAAIVEVEPRIRASYSESTSWINSPNFVEMILEDSVFIIEVLLDASKRRSRILAERDLRTGDPLMDDRSLQSIIKRDLMLLENQLPYFIIERLYNSIPIENPPNPLLRELTTRYFEVGQLEEIETFLHFTDLLRFVRARTLTGDLLPKKSPIRGHICNWFMFVWARTPPVLDREGNVNPLEHMYNAEKLDRGGVELQVVGNEPSLVVNFVNGYLQLPSFSIVRNTAVQLKNIMALEQCHYPRRAHVSNHIIFLDFLIDTEKDVDLLIEKGIIRHAAGESRLVADIVNNLCLGLNDFGCYYSDIATQVINYYNHPIVSLLATLKRVYFANLWRGTATLGAIIILAMTIGQFVLAYIESKKPKK